MLDRLGPEAELHVIDPGARTSTPPSTSSGSPAGTSSTATSASTCCRDLPPMDAALIDGDHNWYTVYNELRLLARGAPGPPARRCRVLILHDVGWPYGRRDLYYDARARSPTEFRQPYAPGGMQPGPDEAARDAAA